MTELKVLAFFREQIIDLKRKDRQGTAQNYAHTLHSFSLFLQGKDIPFKLFNGQLILSYNEWLKKRNILRNSASFYMRNMRAMYNKAVRCGLTRQKFPFQRVYTGIDKTHKRAVSETLIARLSSLDLVSNPKLAFARDLFLFSFCTRGMAFVDMTFLNKTNICYGFITYSRKKTGQPLCVKIEPCIQSIISRYSHEGPYLFPIIHTQEPDAAYRQYQSALSHYNKRLKKLSGLLGEGISLSSYTARHSWATVARNHQVPLSVISAGMGHASEKTTRIYLASLENSIIDQANQRIIASLENSHF